MAELTIADLKDYPSGYDSPREIGDVLIGEDAARLVIEASSSGNDAALQNLLSQPQHIKTALEKPHTIYSEDRPREGPDDVRQVSAMRISNIERAVTAAAGNGHATAVSTLLNFAKQQGMDASDAISRFTINKTIRGGHGAAMKAMAIAYPEVLTFRVGMDSRPLYEAVRWRKYDVTAALLEAGADPFQPLRPPKTVATYHSSLLSHAAMSEGPRMTALLLEHGLPVAGTAALHTAARFGQLDTMNFLMEHGADVDELLPSGGWADWTPMHFAATRGQVDAMKLLEHNGARTDLKDRDGNTPAQILELRKTVLSLRDAGGDWDPVTTYDAHLR